MPKESTVQALVTEYLDTLKRRHPLWWWKVHGHARQLAGVPDLHVVFYGQSIHIEMKRDEAGEASPSQAKRIKEIRRASGVAFVSYEVPSVRNALEIVLARLQRMQVCRQCFALCDATDELCPWCGCFEFHQVRKEL